MRKTLFCVLAVVILTSSGIAWGAPHKVLDQAGREVMVPPAERIQRVVITSLLPLPSVYVLFQGSADRLVGMHPASLSAARHSLLPKVDPRVTQVSSSFIRNGEINVEELLNLKPDLVLFNANNAREREILEKTGIPAVGLSPSVKDFDSVETINSWVDLLGQIFQREDWAAGITEYGRKTYEDIQKRLAGLSEKEKPRILMLFRYSDTEFKASGSRFFGQYWCEASGGINVASELKGMAEINMEQVYEWDPDIIYITNFSKFQPEDLYENKGLPGHDWSGVKAVRERRVYKFPLGMYRWFPPSSDTPLTLMFLARTNYPQLFKDLDLREEVRSYYRRFYRMELTDKEIDGIFTPLREAAGGV